MANTQKTTSAENLRAVDTSAAHLQQILSQNQTARHNESKRLKRVIFTLVIIAVSACLVQIMWGFPELFGYAFNLRTKKTAAIIVVATAIATASMVFQAIVNNRILTPSIMGLDSLFVLVQTFIVYSFGATSFTKIDPVLHFFSSVFLMVGFATLLFKVMFRRDSNNVYFILLQGVVFGSLFGSLTSFMATLIDPGEYFIVQDIGFASFGTIRVNILFYTAAVLACVLFIIFKKINVLNVMGLGKHQAINLGVDYNRAALWMLIAVAILTSISTAMVGPITFLGLIVMNVTLQIMRTFNFKYLIPGCVCISVITLVIAQILVERVFAFNTTVSIMINFVGGIYFVYLLLREQKKW